MSENHWNNPISVEHSPIGKWACYSSSHEEAVTVGRVLTTWRATREMGMGIQEVKFWKKDKDAGARED